VLLQLGNRFYFWFSLQRTLHGSKKARQKKRENKTNKRKYQQASTLWRSTVRFFEVFIQDRISESAGIISQRSLAHQFFFRRKKRRFFRNLSLHTTLTPVRPS
jgi:hypothetical protein